MNANRALWAALMVLSIIGAGVLISGCTPQSKAAVGAAIVGAQDAADSSAAVSLKLPCAMTVGAYHRTLNDIQKAAVDVLCGGDTQAHVTAGDVKTLRNLMAIVEAGAIVTAPLARGTPP